MPALEDVIDEALQRTNAFRQAGTGAVDRSVWSKLGDVVSAADFGVPFNFSTTTEAANAAPTIQAAVDAMNARGRGTVYLPAGVYWTSDPIVMKSRVRLMGAGRHATILKLKAGGATHLITNSAGADVNIEVSDLTVDGNKFAVGNSTIWYDGININTTVDAFHYFSNITIQQVTRDGFHHSGSRGLSTFHGIFVGNPWRYGFYCDTYDNVYTNCQVAGTGTDGIVTTGGPNRFVGGKAYFCGNNSSIFTSLPLNPQSQTMTGSTADGFDNGAPAQDDWRRGCGIRNTASLNEFIGIEIQDTWGPGVVENGYETRFNGVIGNVGDIAPGGARHLVAGSPDTNDRYNGVRAAIQMGMALDCRYDVLVRTQNQRFQTQVSGVVPPSKCDYVLRNTLATARNVKVNALVATTDNSGTARTHVHNLTILSDAGQTAHATIELLVNDV